jgi:hypothetical protein
LKGLRKDALGEKREHVLAERSGSGQSIQLTVKGISDGLKHIFNLPTFQIRISHRERIRIRDW